MKNNETLHIHVKRPHESDQPVRHIGIFPTFEASLLIPALASILSPEIEEVGKVSQPVVEDIREEVLKILFNADILALSRSKGITTITIREKKKSS